MKLSLKFAFRTLLPLLAILTALVEATCAIEQPLTDRPNIILINLDDADTALLSDPMLEGFFPNLHRIAREGTRFTNCHAATPLCGPSRAALLSGRLPLRSRIRVNSSDEVRSNGFLSGYDSYRDLGYLRNDLPIQMARAGYRTVHIGKYLHPNYDDADTPNWDHFLLAAGARYHGTVFMRSVNKGATRRWAAPTQAYRTKREAAEIVRVMQEAFTPVREKPVFLYWAPIAPHTGSSRPEAGLNPLSDMIDKRYESAFSKVVPPWDASVNAPDMRDKHPVMEHIDILPEALLKEYYRPRLLAVRSFDDQLGRVLRELKSQGQFENSYIFITSDNGFQIGQHRLLGKPSPYLDSSNVPLLVWGPGIPSGVAGHHLISQIDLFPTLIELVGLVVPDFADGKSFKPLLYQAAEIDERSWQDEILIQNFESMIDTRRDVEIPFVYSQLRMFDSSYTEYADGHKEFYDLSVDPLELVNLYDDLSTNQQRHLQRRLSRKSRFARLEATLNSPPSTFIVGRQSLRLTGYAVSSRPLRSVRFVARIPELGLYWDGTDWKNGRTGVSAKQLSDASLIARWEDRINTVGLPRGQFTLSIRTRAYDSRESPVDLVNERRFVLDTEPPQAEMEYPGPGRTQRGPIEISGVVSDNVGVRRVYVRIMHIPSGRFWNGETLQGEPIRLRALLDRTRGDWTYQFDAPEGQYRVFVDSVDMARNWQRSPFGRKIKLSD